MRRLHPEHHSLVGLVVAKKFWLFPKPKIQIFENKGIRITGYPFLYICWQFLDFLYICWQKPFLTPTDPNFLVYLLTLKISIAERRAYKIELFWQNFLNSSIKIREKLFASMRRYYSLFSTFIPSWPIAKMTPKIAITQSLNSLRIRSAIFTIQSRNSTRT